MTTPGENFYQWVNSKWLNDPAVVIPPDYPRWGSFIILADQALKDQVALLKEVSQKQGPSEDEVKLALLWNRSLQRFVDWDKGISSYDSILKELKELNRIDLSPGADLLENLPTYFAHCQEVGIGFPFHLDKEGNLEDSANVVLDIGASGLSLPSRDYYLEDSFAERRQFYHTHLQNVSKLIGPQHLTDNWADRVLRFETRLALINMSPAQRRQYDQYYTITALDQFAPNLNSHRFLEEKSKNFVGEPTPAAAKVLGAGEDFLTAPNFQLKEEQLKKVDRFFQRFIDALGLRQVMLANFEKNYPGKAGSVDFVPYRLMAYDGDYFRRLFALLLQPDAGADLRAYLQYKVIRFGSSFSSKDLDEEFFDFFSRRLQGQKEQKTPEKRTVGLVNAWLGELLGKIYVARHFPEENKLLLGKMIEDVLEIMKQSLHTNDWLTAETKEKALVKLGKFVVKLGYPDKWIDYSQLIFTPDDDLFTMQTKVNSFDHRTEFLDRINAPKDRTKWEMSPQTVNAYFHPLNNEIVFPAAILQPPFFFSSVENLDFEVDAVENPDLLRLALNFGAIGAVIAHEITHGYDDQGRKFDSDGNIKDWWQETDAKLFEAKAALMTQQASKWSYQAEDGSKHDLNGPLTLGENLADLGGLSLGCQALARHVTNLTPAAVRPIYRNFFRAWANVWKTKQTEAYLLQQLATDPHSPAEFRANLVRNIPLFYEVFEVQEANQPMWLSPELRVKMW